MSYGIIDDGDEIHIRARITQRWELAELVAKLQQRIDGMPVDISTEHRPRSAYSEADKIEVVPGSGAASATVTVNESRYHKGDGPGGVVTNVTITKDVGPGPYAFDAQDVNQRELKDE